MNPQTTSQARACTRCGYAGRLPLTSDGVCPVCGATPTEGLPPALARLTGYGRMPALLGGGALILCMLLACGICSLSGRDTETDVRVQSDVPVVVVASTNLPTVITVPSATTNPTPSLTATATATASLTATETRTHTPTPTSSATPDVAVETARAESATQTAEARPTATQTAEPSPTVREVSYEVQLYAQKLVDYSDVMSESFSGMGELLQQDPQTWDDTWVFLVSAHIVAIRQAHEDLKVIVPPVDMEEVHAQMLLASEDFYQMTEHLVEGIDNLDEDEIYRAMAYMQSGNEKMAKAVEMVLEYQAQFE